MGTKRNRFFVLAADRKKKVIHEVRLDNPIAATATAANGVLYVTTMRKLYALQPGR